MHTRMANIVSHTQTRIDTEIQRRINTQHAKMCYIAFHIFFFFLAPFFAQAV